MFLVSNHCLSPVTFVNCRYNFSWVFRRLLHTKERQDELCERLYTVLGESCISCKLQLAGPQYDSLQCVSSLSPHVAEELFRFTLSDCENRSQALSSEIKELKKASVTTDNSLSPVHTLLQINCVDHKGLLYDIMRTLKDCNIQVLICPVYYSLCPVINIVHLSISSAILHWNKVSNFVWWNWISTGRVIFWI